jgi:hypothetical protein
MKTKQWCRAACFGEGCPWHGGWTLNEKWAQYEADSHTDLARGHQPRIEYRRGRQDFVEPGRFAALHQERGLS